MRNKIAFVFIFLLISISFIVYMELNTTSTTVAPTTSTSTSTTVAPTTSTSTSTTVAPTTSTSTSTTVAPTTSTSTSTTVAPTTSTSTTTIYQDNVPPTWTDKTITIKNMNPTYFEVNWKAASDNTNVAGYRFYLNNVFKGEYIRNNDNNSIFLDGLTEDTTYLLEVIAYDDDSNESIDNPTLSITTSTPTTTTTTTTTVPQATINITVTVENNGYGSNVYYLDGTQNSTINILNGNKYRFDQSNSSNSGHPLRLSSSQGGSEYTVNVTTNGTPGTQGAYTEIEVTEETPNRLYIYCTIHAGMGVDSVISKD